MYIQEVSIDLKTEVDKDELIDEFSLLMSFYRGNGQTQGRIESQFIEGSRILAMPYTIEKDSLDKMYNNGYVIRQSKKIEKLCGSILRQKTVGKSYSSYEASCVCVKSDFFILITNYISIESPLTCGTCNKCVPLYKLPKYYDSGYMPILSWETNYISCDSLQMNCEVGEIWALEQMQEINSQLSIQGLTICKRIEEITSTPVYYYLYNYRKIENNQTERLCPSCGEKWELKNSIHNTYDYRCNKCKLISTISSNSE